ncbi:MAG: MBL fold metallo-hydrolase [Bacillota bacterium]
MTEIIPRDIFKVRLPLPFRLDHVNCYAVKGRDGWTIVDAGLNYDPARKAWLEFMDRYGFDAGEITGIYITHYHPDHYGAAGWLQQLSGAPVYMSSVDAALADKIWKQGRRNMELLSRMYLENGVPAGLITKMLDNIMDMRSMVTPHPDITILSGEEEVRLGDRYFRVVSTPGHSDGHVCFYNKESGILLSGDHLLPDITSNISLWPQSHPNPLDNFLTSLAENRRLKISLALPAHGECFTNVDQRLAELEEHHRDRLNVIKRATSRGASAYQACMDVFGSGLSLHEMRFALTETMAHLVYLEKRGELRLNLDGNVYKYSI